jgi:hypothetical protein
VSEYQYYEFLAIDRPLDDDEQAAVRSLSTRARITATTFVNEYHWGDFKGDPATLMERYYDAHLYLANWGTHRLMFRLPTESFDLDTVGQYCVDEFVNAWTVDGSLVLDLHSEDELGEFDFDYEAAPLLSGIVGVRAELTAGDLRPLYLAWLAAYGAWERDEDAFDRAADGLEPPVPPGLNTLTAAQRALADFLRLDEDLLAVAAEASVPVDAAGTDPGRLADWVAGLPAVEKDQYLARVALGESMRVQLELLHRFRGAAVPTTTPHRRRVGDVLDEAARRRAERRRQEEAQAAAEHARQERERAAAYQRRLDQLAAEGEAAWSRVDELIGTRKPSGYDAAVRLLIELRDLSDRANRRHDFTPRAEQLRQAHARKPSLIDRLNRAGL